MTVLDAAHAFDLSLPRSYVPILERLERLRQLSKGPKETKQERSAEACALYDELLHLSAVLEEPTPLQHRQETPAFKRWFGEAVLLWMELAKSNGAPLVDTVDVAGLQEFPHDFPADDAARAEMIRALRIAFEWQEDEWAGLLRWFEHVTSNLELKRRISGALANFLNQEDRKSPSGRVSFMQAFYAGAPFLPGEVDFMLTTTAVVFFVPRRGMKLTGEAWEGRTDSERDAVTAFLAKLDRGNIAETKRFPSFGYGEGGELGAQLVAYISSALNVHPNVVISTLKTMFSLIPKQLIAKYLVHDMWGHVWQEVLSDFEYEYDLLSTLEEELTPACAEKYGELGAKRLATAFVVTDNAVHLDAAEWRKLVAIDLRGRLRVGASFVLSEVLADFMESKYSRARPTEELPTTSLIPSTQLKLDLSIADLSRQIQRATAPYRAFAESAAMGERFVAALIGSGLPASGCDQAVAEARAVVQTLLPLFEPGLAPEVQVSGERVASTFLRRYLVQVLLVMAELETALAWTRTGGEVWRNPGACPDLLCIALAHFYEQHRSENFWYMDQIARNEFGAACSRLRTALATD